MHNVRAIRQQVHIGGTGFAPIGVKRQLGDVGFRHGGCIAQLCYANNGQTEIAVLPVCRLFTVVVGLMAVFTGTDKQAAERVPIVQENGGLAVYQALC